MTLFYHHPQAHGRLNDDKKQFSFEEVRKLVASLRGSPDATLIGTLPGGDGLDFHALDDGRVWLEFYTDGLHSATVSPDVAERVFARAFSLPTLTNTKAVFSDLIAEWDY